MIRSMRFKKDHRCFKAGAVVEFHPGLNLLVGLNGCGKSTIIQLVSEYKDPLFRGRTLEAVDIKIEDSKEIIAFDFEKDNKRTLSWLDDDDMEFQVASKFSSHGETLVYTLDKLMSQAPTGAILVFDEPDMAASIRVAQAIRKGFEKICKDKNIQIIASIHHPFIMEGQPEVFDVAALCWKSGDEVIRDMLSPGPLFIKREEVVDKPRKRYGKKSKK